MDNSAQHLLEAAYHFRSVPPAWRSAEEWDRAIHGMKMQHLRGNEYCTHVGPKTKWIARCAPGGKLCVVVASSKFHYQPLEECVDAMEDMLGLGLVTAKDLSKLGLQIRIQEGQSSDAVRKKMLDNKQTAGSGFQSMKDVKISLLHRSGTWFSLNNGSSASDVLRLEPYPADQEAGTSGMGESIKNTGDYHSQLNQCTAFAIASSSSPNSYLVSRERKNVFGKEKKHLFRKKYFAAQYAKLESWETPETFVFTQNTSQGGMSIISTLNGCFLSRNRRGEFVFTEDDKKCAEKVCFTDGGDGAWFIDAPDLQAGVASEGLLFVCILTIHDKKTLVSSHAPGRPTAWRTAESWDCITDVLLENVKGQSSTFVIDWDTGHKWFATNCDGKELFVVIATEGFPLYYGTKTLLAMENLRHTLGTDEQRPPSSSELYRVMRDVEIEYRYELCFGNDEILGLIEDVENLTDKMMENIDGLKENIAMEQEIIEKATQLHVLAQQFKKKSNKKKWRVAATATAGGAIVGGLFGLVVGCPADLIVVQTQAAAVALSAAVGAAPGFVKGIVLLSTDTFWKRKFVNLGRCIDSRRRKRSRDKTQINSEQKRAENIKHNETTALI